MPLSLIESSGVMAMHRTPAVPPCHGRRSLNRSDIHWRGQFFSTSQQGGQMEMTEPKINMTMQETADEQSTLLATLPSKTAIRRNLKKQLALFRQDAHSIRDKETRNQI